MLSKIVTWLLVTFCIWRAIKGTHLLPPLSEQKYTVWAKNTNTVNANYGYWTARSMLDCAKLCIQDNYCWTYAYNKYTRMCNYGLHWLGTTSEYHPVTFEEEIGTVLYNVDECQDTPAPCSTITVDVLASTSPAIDSEGTYQLVTSATYYNRPIYMKTVTFDHFIRFYQNSTVWLIHQNQDPRVVNNYDYISVSTRDCLPQEPGDGYFYNSYGGVYAVVRCA